MRDKEDDANLKSLKSRMRPWVRRFTEREAMFYDFANAHLCLLSISIPYSYGSRGNVNRCSSHINTRGSSVASQDETVSPGMRAGGLWCRLNSQQSLLGHLQERALTVKAEKGQMVDYIPNRSRIQLTDPVELGGR